LQRAEFLACFVLHSRTLRETSLLVDLMTPDFGLTRVVARGARSARSRVRPMIQPFRPLLVSWAGRHDLKTLSGLEEQGRPCQLAGLELAAAYYMNELLLRMLPPDAPCPTVFASYAQTLDQLSKSSAGLRPGRSDPQSESGQSEQMSKAGNDALETGLRLFELELLDSLGLVPDFANCRRTTAAHLSTAQQSDALKIESGLRYRYYPEAGYAVEVADAGDTIDARNPDNAVEDSPNSMPSVEVSGETLLALGTRQLQSKQVLREAKNVMRRQLAQHLGGQPLKSREMIAFYTAGRQDSSDG